MGEGRGEEGGRLARRVQSGRMRKQKGLARTVGLFGPGQGPQNGAGLRGEGQGDALRPDRAGACRRPRRSSHRRRPAESRRSVPPRPCRCSA